MQGSQITTKTDPELMQEQHTQGQALPLWAAQDTREQGEAFLDKLLSTFAFGSGEEDT